MAKYYTDWINQQPLAYIARVDDDGHSVITALRVCLAVVMATVCNLRLGIHAPCAALWWQVQPLRFKRRPGRLRAGS